MSTVAGYAKVRTGELVNLMAALNVRNTIGGDPRRRAQAKTAYNEHYKTSEVNVPKTVFEEKEDVQAKLKKEPFKMPDEYITFSPAARDYNTIIEYDCDEEDELWLKEMGEVRKQKKKPPFSVTTFELVMDRLEKECRFEARGGVGGSMDADDVCCVCGDGDGDNANQIIYCDMCNIAVHQECYGVPYIPEGSWLCRRCKLSPGKAVTCCLCPSPSGAFKQTSDGRWAHVICAIWLNEVCFGNAVFLEPIEGAQDALKKRARLRCLLCKKKEGACMQCSSRSCVKAFHVTCAQNMGLVMHVEMDNDPDKGDVDVKRFVYCHQHAGNGKDPLSKKEMQESIRRARRTMTVTCGSKPTINMPTVSREAVDRIAQRTKLDDISDIIRYWFLKRNSRSGVPLIRRLQVECLQPKQHRMNVSELTTEAQKMYMDFRNMRYALETTRLLSEMVRKRETHKRNFIVSSRQCFEKFMQPISVYLRDIIEKLAHKDKNEIFAEPVQLDGYSAVVKTPMDLATIRSKNAALKYNNVNDLRKDVLLMTDNCEKFNHDNEFYLNYGRRYRQKAERILEDAETYYKQLDECIKDDEMLKTIFNVTSYGRDDVVGGGDADRTAQLEEAPPTLNVVSDVDDVGVDGAATSAASALKENEPQPPELSPNRRRARSSRRRRPANGREDMPPVLEAESRQPQDRDDDDDDDDDNRDDVKSQKSPMSPRSPQATRSQTKAPPAVPLKTAWENLFGQQKRKVTLATTPGAGAASTSVKRKKISEGQPTILPFLSKDFSPRSPDLFKGPSQAATMTSTARVTRAGAVSQKNNNQPAPFASYREMSITSPLPADTASSAESSTDEDVVTTKTTYVNGRRERATAPIATAAGSTNTRRRVVTTATTEAATNADKRRTRSTGRERVRTRTVVVDAVQKAREESKSKFAHNAIVDVDGKAARVILPNYAHLEGFSREKRFEMSSTRPPSSKKGDDDEFVYVRFFTDSKESWLPASRMTLLDATNTKAGVAGLKQARQWQQRYMEP